MSVSERASLSKDWTCPKCHQPMPKGTPIAKPWNREGQNYIAGIEAIWNENTSRFEHVECPPERVTSSRQGSAATRRANTGEGPGSTPETAEPLEPGHLYVAPVRDYCMVEIAARFSRFKISVGSHSRPDESLDDLVSRVKTTAKRRFDEEREWLQMEEPGYGR